MKGFIACCINPRLSSVSDSTAAFSGCSAFRPARMVRTKSLLGCEQHERLVLRVRELIRVVDRRQTRDLSLIVELERGVAAQERGGRGSRVPLVATAFVAADDVRDRRADAVGQLG